MAGKRRLYRRINIITGPEKDLEKTRSLCSRRAANVNNYKHKLRVAGEPAVFLNPFQTLSHIN